MNIPATLDPSTQPEDLVLRFVGGANDGESVSISTKCCKLGVAKQSEKNGSVRGQCTIYRGPAGVAVQSHGDELLVNGEAKSVHWLEQGDKIQVSNSQAVEVVQLGTLANAGATPEVEMIQSVAPEVVSSIPVDQVEPVVDLQTTEFETEVAESDAATETVTRTADVAGDRIDFVSQAVQDQLAHESSAFSEPSSFSQPTESEAPLEEPVQEVESESLVQEPASAQVGQLDEGASQRLDSLENSVNQLHDQAANVDRRFDRLEDSLNALTEHLERLAVGSLSSASVEATPNASSPVAFVAQPDQDFVEASIPDAPAETAPLAAPEIVGAPPAPQTLEPAVEDSAPSSRGDNYEKSIAALFSELANTDTPEAPNAQAAVAPVVEPSSYEQGVSQTHGEVDPVVSSVPTFVETVATERPLTEEIQSAVTPMATDTNAESSAEQPAVGFTERMLASMHDETPTLSSEEVASVVGLGIAKPEATVESLEEIQSAVIPTATDTNTESSAEQPAVGFTERMLASMHDETPTLSSEEVASVVGLGIEKPEATFEESPVVETPSAVEVVPAVPAAPEVEEATPVLRAEVATESVADIFARLHSGASTNDGVDESPVPAAPIRQTVQTTFEDIQASISAALDADISAGPEADPGYGHVEQAMVAEPVSVEPVAVETVSSAVEAVEPSEPADDVNSVMERLRNSLEAEEGSETTEETNQTGATETEQATDMPDGGRKQQDSVEDYMSMLMSRMNGDSDGSEVSGESDSSSGVSDFNRPQSGLLEEAAVNTLLTEEEFVPKQKPIPIKSLDKMRELANSTSRSAVQRSERAVQIERKKSLILQALALGSLALAVLMIWGKSYIPGGAFAMIFFVTSAYFLYDTVSPSRAKEIAQVKKSTGSSSKSESTPSTDED